MNTNYKYFYVLISLALIGVFVAGIVLFQRTRVLEQGAADPNLLPYQKSEPIAPKDFSSLEEFRIGDPEMYNLLTKRKTSTLITQ